MKTVKNLFLLTSLIYFASCEDGLILEDLISEQQENATELAAEMEVPISIIVDDFDEDSVLSNRTTFVYRNGLLETKSSELVKHQFSISHIEYLYENSLPTRFNELFGLNTHFLSKLSYNEENKIMRFERFNDGDSLVHSEDFIHTSDNRVINENIEIQFVEGQPFQIAQITSDNERKDFSYVDGAISSIEYRDVSGELLKIEKFEFLEKEVLGAYNKFKFNYGLQWKINVLLFEGYSYNLEERYIKKHTITLPDGNEVTTTFNYEFDSLGRVSKQFLEFQSHEENFSCITYYNY